MERTNIIKNTMKRVDTTEANVNMVLDYIEAHYDIDGIEEGTLNTLVWYLCLYAYNYIDTTSEDYTEEAIQKATEHKVVAKFIEDNKIEPKYNLNEDEPLFDDLRRSAKNKEQNINMDDFFAAIADGLRNAVK